MIDRGYPFSHDTDEVLLARLVWGEARGERLRGRIAVACSVMNRTGRHKWWGHTLKEVILHPYQYSAFNEYDENYEKLKEPERHDRRAVWHDALDVARMVLEKEVLDVSRKATHYHRVGVVPDWSLGYDPVVIVGNHVFYAGIP